MQEKTMMKERIREEAERALKEGWHGILGLRKRWGQVGPHLFQDPEELGLCA